METGIYLMTTQGPRQEAGLWCYTMEALLRGKEYTRTGYGKMYQTSRNELALTALSAALSRLKEPTEIVLYTGNLYLIAALQNNWLDAWQQAGWSGKKGKPVAHTELWQEIAEGLSGCRTTLEPGEGHKYSGWQRFQLEKLRTVDFLRWEEKLSPRNPVFE